MRGPEAPVAGAEDGVTRRIHALLDPARTPGFDWRGELREGGHRKKVQAYGLSFAEKCLQAERFADARLLLEAYAQARRAAGLSEDPRALELHARVSAAAAAASKGEAPATDGGGRPSLSAQERPSLSRCNTPETQASPPPSYHIGLTASSTWPPLAHSKKKSRAATACACSAGATMGTTPDNAT